MKKIIIAISLILFSCFSFADTTLVWNKAPLDVVLPVDKQVYITFPTQVQYFLPESLYGKLDVQNNNDVVYLTAKTEFADTQIKVRAGNQIILMNFSAQKDASTTPINVIFPKKVTEEKKSLNPFAANNNVTMQDLLRYTIQQYYAPERLITENNAITHSQELGAKQYQLFADGSVTALALDSYTANGITVTAIYLKNNTKQDINLTPNDICGTWVGSAYFPQSKLKANGSKYDSTMLFLLSKNDFISTYHGTCGLGE